MLNRTYDDQNCSIARAPEIVGDRWTLLVIRDAFEGIRRFDDFQANLGVARNVLTDRLSRLCAEGVLRRCRYQERPERYEYRLTGKGVGLWPARCRRSARELDRAPQYANRLISVPRIPPDSRTGDPHGTEAQTVDGEVPADGEGVFGHAPEVTQPEE